MTTPAMGREIAAELPGSEFVEIPGAGHLVNIEAPEAVNAALRAFLDQHRDRAVRR